MFTEQQKEEYNAMSLKDLAKKCGDLSIEHREQKREIQNKLVVTQPQRPVLIQTFKNSHGIIDHKDLELIENQKNHEDKIKYILKLCNKRINYLGIEAEIILKFNDPMVIKLKKDEYFNIESNKEDIDYNLKDIDSNFS